mmetsp:Transcript_27155/g.56653  ORF Transcript_27155/g.56653 Transcript_27155/m.56653 type:complete len:80 (+) Transcript_27155:8-247(+)
MSPLVITPAMVISEHPEEAKLFATDAEPESCGNDIDDDDNAINHLLSPAEGGWHEMMKNPPVSKSKHHQWPPFIFRRNI